MRIAIYNTGSGAIRQHMPVPPGMVDIQCRAGEEFFLNCPAIATHIIDGDPVAIQPPPDMDAVRATRSHLLSDCDWTQLPDAPVDAQVWATYRQLLRDFPAVCDPTNPDWPLPPSSK